MKTKERPPQIRDLVNYFGVNTPKEVGWAHRVNIREDLEKEIQNPSTMMIEVDVHYLPDTKEIVMIHYDWGFEDVPYNIWLTQAAQLPKEDKLYFNEWIESIIASKKGAKLDYKNHESVPISLEYIKGFGDLQNTPLIFNADVLRGPGGRVPHFNAHEFIELINTYFPDSIISLGFTTSYKQDADYSHDLLQQILALTKKYDGHVTFPIRACYIRRSEEALLKLLEDNDCSISIFNDETVSDEDVAYIENIFDHERTFMDIWKNIKWN